jgi:hypothetical protein
MPEVRSTYILPIIHCACERRCEKVPFFLEYPRSLIKTPTKYWGARRIHAQTFVTLLSFTVRWSAYCLSVPKQRQVCNCCLWTSSSHQRHSVLSVVSKNEYKGNAFAVVHTVSEKLHVIKELLCMWWIKKAWNVFYPRWWTKCEVILLRG